MRLKELTVQGYKSFATKTRFEFPPGVTAIVGPNGSGKSNIADAVRWALGEQRPTQLRARRTDDLIFSGTERRPRSGLAEVRLVLDNADGWLPVDYAEVEVTRRAHRDGTNEYAINGATVRLRDVLDLLGGRLGQSTYTVIGQGLVDSSLALRPEDRRGLIDEAAGIVPLQRRRDAALRRLDETDVNLTRVRDVLAELTPRLRRMERLAERADRYEELAGSLVSDLEVWYGFQWRQSRITANAARSAVEAQSALAVAATAAVAERETALREADAEADLRNAMLSEKRQLREGILQSVSAAREAAAVAHARLEGLGERMAENAAARPREAAEHLALGERLVAVEAELDEIAAGAALREIEASDARRRLEEAEIQRRTLAEAWEAARRAAMDAEASEVEARRRLQDLQASLAIGADVATATDVDQAARRAELAAAQEAARATALEATASAEQLAASDAEMIAAERRRELAYEALRSARDAHAEASARRGALRARSRALSALLSTSGGGDATASLEAAADGNLGRLAQAVEVEPGWEAAAAVALGSMLAGLLLPDAGAVARVLSTLPQEVDGQITLIPGGRSATGAPWSPRQGETRAVEVVRCPLAPHATANLLADVAFVESVESALAAVARSDGPLAAATRNGRLVYRSGVVVAGAPAREILAQERERRSLIDLEAAAEAEEASRAAAVDEANGNLAVADAALADCSGRRSEADARNRLLAAQLHETRTTAERLRDSLAWADEAAARHAAEMSSVDGRRAELEAEIVRGKTVAAETSAREVEARTALEAHQTGLILADAERSAEAAREATTTAASRRAEADVMRRQIAALAATSEARLQRDAALAQEQAVLESETQRLAEESERLAKVLDAANTNLAPEEKAASEAALERRREAAELDGLRSTAHEAEARLGDARLAAAKAESRLERTLEQLAADADLLPSIRGIEPRSDLAAASELPLPTVHELPEGLEGRISKVRGQLRDLGAVDPEALAAYRESAEHHRLLTEQRADLLAAEADLREALATLDAEMSGRFERTFNAVAEAFGVSFPMLFGGGEARLALDEESGGVEIFARPPGKRTQPLALLSGGERALTGVALVFALLKASETPFVVLDEVDAALDEANVDRFRAALEDLGSRTQVVIITHNRGTVQTANTVYGISMGEDGASQTLSLRVEEVVRG